MSSNLDPHKQVGRFAPSPTGMLHFGSLITAVASYCLVKQVGGSWLVRIDDLDQPRVVAGAADHILYQLEQLGLYWDGSIVYQSRRSQRYQEVLAQLTAAQLTYPCVCSRKQVVASAPHFGDDGPVYPGTCRNLVLPNADAAAIRLKTNVHQITFTDRLRGTINQDVAAQVGDFILRRRDGVFAYQLAVVVDDHDSGVTQVVRGRDLLGSTARQIFLARQLRFAVPEYAHLPLALDRGGEKISKRHQIGAVEINNPSQLIYRALEFLGQAPPRELYGERPQQLLRWGCDNFALAAVPCIDSCVDSVEG